MKIGLFGFNTAQGLGYVNRDIAKHLGIDRWIIPKHSRFPMLPTIDSVDNFVVSKKTISEQTARQWLGGLDALLFVETAKSLEYMPRLCRVMGIKTVCVPMVEWLRTDQDWTRYVDLWLAPTAFSYSQLLTLRVRGQVKYCPWPIDTGAFEFRQRQRCERFVYAHGNGGPHDRKGGTIVAEAARLAPEIPLIVYSQVQDGYLSGVNRDVDWPATVEFRGSTATPADLYRDGDVFVMPSRFDGLGLQLYECQAAGMPLIATDGPPMSEANPWVRLLCTPSRVDLAYPYVSWDVSPQAIADVMRSTIGADISQASYAARSWVVANRDWATMADRIRAML
jgi:glycosyltransferase involved in cell wall biosynthesis